MVVGDCVRALPRYIVKKQSVTWSARYIFVVVAQKGGKREIKALWKVGEGTGLVHDVLKDVL